MYACGCLPKRAVNAASQVSSLVPSQVPLFLHRVVPHLCEGHGMVESCPPHHQCLVCVSHTVTLHRQQVAAVHGIRLCFHFGCPFLLIFLVDWLPGMCCLLALTWLLKFVHPAHVITLPQNWYKALLLQAFPTRSLAAQWLWCTCAGKTKGHTSSLSLCSWGSSKNQQRLLDTS